MGTSTTIVGQDATTPPDDPYFQQREADLARFAQRESGNRNITQASGGPASGYYQMEDASRGGSGTWETAAAWAGLPKLPDGTYGRAMDYSKDDQHAAAVALYDRRGAQPWAMSAPGARGTQMASTDTSTADDTTTPDPSVLATPALAATPDQLRQALGLLGTSIGGGDKSQSAISKIGAALGGGQGNLSGADAEAAGNRSLINFGIGLLAQSGYHPVRTTMGEALAAGLQGAQASELGSQQLQRDTVQKALGYLQEQQGMGIKQGMLSVAQQEAKIKAQQMQIELQRMRQLGILAGGGSPTTTAATPPPTPPAVTTGPAPAAPSDVSALPVPPIPPEGGPPAATATAPDGTPIGKGSPIPAGKLLKSDAGSGGAQVAADVAAMQQGQQLAQGAPGASTALTAGPGAPTGGISPAQQAIIDKIQPQPGWPGAPAPAATTTPPAVPAPQSPTMATTPGGSVPLPPHIQTLLDNANAGQLDPGQADTIQHEIASASLAQDGGKALAAAFNHKAEFLQQNKKQALDAAIAWQAEANKAQIAQTAAERAAGVTMQQKQADADMSIAQKDIEGRNTEATKAGTVIPILQQMSTQLQNLPKGAMGGLAATLDPNGILRGYLPRELGGNEQQATAAQMLQAARNYLSIELKPAATGSLRVPEMENLKSYTPGQLNTPQAQQEMIARLIAYQRRVQQEADFAGNYFGRSSDPNNPNSPRIYDNRGMLPAMNAPVKYDQNGNVTGGGLGPVVPEPPPLNAPDAEHQAYQNYVRKNVAPGMPYQTYESKKNADGSFQLDANGKPIPQRVTKVQGYD